VWTKSYSLKVENVDPEKIWNVWTDVNQWNTWQNDIEFAKLNSKLKLGSKISFRPKGGPSILLEIVEFEDKKKFTDVTRFPLAKMYDAHELIIAGNIVEIKTTVSIKGPLSFIWKKIVAENIVKDLPKQTKSLIERVGNV
jgi:hypothetical protein